ncbi:MAG: MFS transporter [Polyangiaceae bacterium]|nr:MFS transporter [Polyangiaceae bacterium]
MEPPRANRREIFGWAMFDFANSSYTTVIITVIYAVVFPKIIVGDGPEYRRGNLLWSIALAISYALVVLLAPLLGAIMDYRAAKKSFLFGSYVLTIVATAALGFVDPGAVPIAMMLVVLSNLGFAAGESFIASFLPDLGPKEKLGRISGLAWGLGYVGGLLSTLVVQIVTGEAVIDNYDRVRWVGPLTGLFFGLAAIPTFLFVKERGTPQTLPPGQSLLGIGFSQLRTTMRDLPNLRQLAVFMTSLFFAMAGLGIVISFAFIYGDQVIRWKPSTQIAMFVLTNLSAAGGAVVFGLIQDRFGNLRTYRATLVVWLLAIIGIHQTPALSGALGLSAEHVYLGVGGLAGLCLGATQSAGRTVVAVLSPEGRAGEMFGFWGLSGKLAAASGLLLLGWLQSAFGLKNAILLCALLFAIAFIVAGRVVEESPSKDGKRSRI